MFQKTSQDRVKGFLHAAGTRIINGSGEEILLTGWGLGNWLLCEGYMWLAGEGERFDRSRQIEAVICELTGKDYADRFWKAFRDHYITRDDIKQMKLDGYNSVRIPFNWRILLEDKPGVCWRPDAFETLDRCLKWCEEFGLYAFLDLHGAPGGQTGTNIDDSADNVPRLFLDSDSWEKALAIWEKIATRYHDRWIVGGYDLLNEPIRPAYEGQKDYDYLLPKLKQFYQEAIAVIRRQDKLHMVSLEGAHWATDTAVFDQKYDENMVIHFHRYGCIPDREALEPYLQVSQKLNVPLWLGETGENLPEWIGAICHLSLSMNIGYCLWPWKKMECANSPCSIRKPEGWEKLIDYTHGGPKTSAEETQSILNQFLENMKIENCLNNQAVTDMLFRRPGCRVFAGDFDWLPGKGISCNGLRNSESTIPYRRSEGMSLIPRERPAPINRFVFDCGWDNFMLELTAGEFACYTFRSVVTGCVLMIDADIAEECLLVIEENGEIILQKEYKPGPLRSETVCAIKEAEVAVMKIKVIEGTARLCSISIVQKDGYQNEKI